jgi:hypothetical protein
MSSDLLVLWRIGEAYESEGKRVGGSVGSQMKGVLPGDRLFIAATENNELFLLGAIRVTSVQKVRDRETKDRFGGFRAEGRSVFGSFTMIPLAQYKWDLRFDSNSDRLKRAITVGYQLQQHRRLTAKSADLLSRLLIKRRGQDTESRIAFKKEGRLMERSLSIRERNPAIRRLALHRYGFHCQICGFSFERRYGAYKECVEIHHLDPIASRTEPTNTAVSRVIVVCPNCHRALHRTTNPSNWGALKRLVERRGQ